MLGWWFVIAQGHAAAGAESTLLTWEAGVSGLRWLDDLVKADKVQQLRGDGYPNLYQGRAADILPAAYQVINMIDFKHKLFKPEFRQERIDACLPDDLITIEAWDQS